MALEQHTTPEFRGQTQLPTVRPSPHEDLARLATLHDEAAETAVLANLLGRTPYMAGALAIMTLLTVALSGIGAGWPETAIWLFFVFAGVAAVIKAYAHAIHAPFERATLRGFRDDMKAVTVYAGVGWGAGAFLALPSSAGILALAAFALGGALVVAAIVRDSDLALAFLVPAAVVAALSAMLRPLDAGAMGGLAVIVTAAAAAFIILATRQMFHQSPEFHRFPGLPQA